MDIKKKLESAYMPDKKSQREKILIGLSGGIDSFVTAYLLKIQKYELLAVTIVNSVEDLPSEAALSCHISQSKIELIKDFCHKLGIPLQVIKAGQEFTENVVDPWIAERLLGRSSIPCWNCHEMKMRLLYHKMLEAGAKKMATGHYAKLFHHEAHNTVFVHTSNDEVHDQSALLSRLPHDILSSLILPLSDLSKKEVIKLGENFGVAPESRTVKFLECLSWNEQLEAFFLKKVPQKLIQPGEITDVENSQSFGEHNGVYSHTFGQQVQLKDSGKQLKGIFGSYYYPEKKMIIVEDKYFNRDKLILKKCRISEEVSLTEPVKGFLVISAEKTVECWIHPKSLSTVFLELMQEEKLIPGRILTVTKKKGKNAKVYLTGEVEFLDDEEVSEEGEENVPKINPTLDF